MCRKSLFAFTITLCKSYLCAAMKCSKTASLKGACYCPSRTVSLSIKFLWVTRVFWIREWDSRFRCTKDTMMIDNMFTAKIICAWDVIGRTHPGCIPAFFSIMSCSRCSPSHHLNPPSTQALGARIVFTPEKNPRKPHGVSISMNWRLFIDMGMAAAAWPTDIMRQAAIDRWPAQKNNPASNLVSSPSGSNISFTGTTGHWYNDRIQLMAVQGFFFAKHLQAVWIHLCLFGLSWGYYIKEMELKRTGLLSRVSHHVVDDAALADRYFEYFW